MKQKSRAIVLKLAAIAVLAVVLATALVACNTKSSKRGSSTNTNSGATVDSIFTNGVLTREDLDACIAYVYDAMQNGSNSASFHFNLLPEDQEMFRGLENHITIADSQYRYNAQTDSYLGLNLYVFNYKDVNYAKDALSYVNDNNFYGYFRMGKQIYFMTFFDEQESLTEYAKSIDEISVVVKKIKVSKLPTDAMTKARHDFIMDTFNQKLSKEALADENIKYLHGSYEVYQGSESFYCNVEYKNTKAQFFTGWSNENNFLEICRKDLQNFDELYTSDSYIDFEKEEGFVFVKRTDKVKDSEIKQNI